MDCYPTVTYDHAGDEPEGVQDSAWFFFLLLTRPFFFNELNHQCAFYIVFYFLSLFSVALS